MQYVEYWYKYTSSVSVYHFAISDASWFQIWLEADEHWKNDIYWKEYKWLPATDSYFYDYNWMAIMLPIQWTLREWTELVLLRNEILLVNVDYLTPKYMECWNCSNHGAYRSCKVTENQPNWATFLTHVHENPSGGGQLRPDPLGSLSVLPDHLDALSKCIWKSDLFNNHSLNSHGHKWSWKVM